MASEPILDRALALVRTLRAGCPWDAAQTPQSLEAYLIEETLEVADAVARGDDPALRAELGDLLLNLAFQIVLAEERGAFTAEDVVRGLEEKMRRRHPHIWGGADERPHWEEMKARERAGRDRFAGIAERLDPLSRAQRIQDRVSGVGFDWPDVRGAWEKFLEEVREVERRLPDGAGRTARSGEHDAPPDGGAPAAGALEEELGDLLFAAVNVIRLSGAHAATALRRANAKFERRFRRLEALARERGVEPGAASLEELDRLWDEVKREEDAARSRRTPQGESEAASPEG
jgi:ATP diphosphatase